MWFLFGNERYDVEIIEKQKTRSPHTGNELKILHCRLAINGEYNKEAFLKLIEENKDRGLTALDEKGNKTEDYIIGNTSYSHKSGEEYYSFEIELKEKESLNIKELIIESKKYIPYAYKERFDDGALIIEAKVELNKEETKTLKNSTKDKNYFSVIRKGINDDKISMRFGLCFWSESKGTIKHSLYLIQDIYDEKQEKSKNPFVIFEYNTANISYKIIKKLEETVNLLVDKSIINRDELHDDFFISEDDLGNISNIFYKVKDVDDYKF